jgi:hypothetical protein
VWEFRVKVTMLLLMLAVYDDVDDVAVLLWMRMGMTKMLRRVLMKKKKKMMMMNEYANAEVSKKKKKSWNAVQVARSVPVVVLCDDDRRPSRHDQKLKFQNFFCFWFL